MLIERASKPLHFPKDINSSSMAVNRQAVAQAATKSSVIGETYLLNKTLSRWKTRPVPETDGVQVTSIFANPTLVFAKVALPFISVAAVFAKVAEYEKVFAVTAVIITFPIMEL